MTNDASYEQVPTPELPRLPANVRCTMAWVSVRVCGSEFYLLANSHRHALDSDL